MWLSGVRIDGLLWCVHVVLVHLSRGLSAEYTSEQALIYIYGLGEHCLCINIDVKRLVIGFHSLTHIASVFFFSGSPSAGKIGLAVLPVPIYVYTKIFV